jgi:16S rRNA (guanine527-N7)-methyltransferase
VARRQRRLAKSSKAVHESHGGAAPPAGAPGEGGWQDELEDGLRALGVSLPPSTPSRFAQYAAEILRWRARINLTGLRTPQAILRHGFLDSLACLAALRPGDLRVVDIGSGAGFPGLPLALARPDLEVALIEANRRRHSFLAHACRSLGLRNVRCHHGRAELLAHDPELRGRFDVAFARAVRRLEEAAGLAAPFLRAGGVFVAQPGPLPAFLAAIPGYAQAQTLMLPAGDRELRRPLGLLIYPRAV